MVTSGAWELLAVVLVTVGEDDFLTAVNFGFGDATFTDEAAAFV